ncbi:MAG: hypothetical protein NC097_01460 [Clostridium sp.]|nr:hypothetical protein [Prevotella sp.]MCM1428448.1 hypothetical protein [Clostridium sp.]MCM1474913.1 hypothetical protein [Muribaculaceae bacterium]
MIDINVNLEKFDKKNPDLLILTDAIAARQTAHEMIEAKRYVDALERTVSAMKTLRDFSDFENTEFRALLVALLFDLSEIHFALKDYKQSEKELDTLFKVLAPLVKSDSERFGQFHVLAMELSTRILRSRKKAMDMLVKQQINAEQLYEKVNSGVTAATDKLVESLRRVGQLLASSGDYRAAMKFIAEAIKISKKRAGRVTRKEVKMTIEMAEIMMRVGAMRPRAKRLLTAILPHAIALETIELEEEILALTEILGSETEKESKWKHFLHTLTHPRRKKETKAE